MPTMLTRWEPFGEFADLRSRLDRMFDQMAPVPAQDWTPAIDVERRDDHLLVRADVPGFAPEDVKIEVDDGVLTIRGEREDTTEDKQKDYVRRERRYGSFARAMTLPPGTDAAQITARTHDGVLEVDVPLPKETAKQPVTITPKAS